MRCQIGLYDASDWRWLDGTSYDWGILGTNTSNWDDDDWFEAVDCVLVENSFNSRTWKQYACHSDMAVNCGVCKTPEKRSYIFGMNGTISNNNTNNNVVYFRLNGNDLFENGTDMLEWIVNISSDNGTRLDFNTIFTNETNLGQITSVTIAIPDQMDLAIGMYLCLYLYL